MKLIDADALPSALFQKHVHDEEELEPMLYFEDAVKVVENVPTINAIPVEWLRGLMNILVTGDALEQGQALFLSNVIEAWQKEQEANDGTN